MRTEIAFSHASQSLVEHTVHKASETAVLVCVDDGYLSVMIACHIKVFSIYVCSKETAAHSIDINTVDSCQISVLIPFKYSNAFIFNGVQKFSVFGDCRMRSIADLDFTALCQESFFHVYIIYLNTLAAAVSIGSHISNVFFIPHK